MRIKAVLFDLGETLLNYGDVDVDACFFDAARLTYDYLADLAGGSARLGDFTRYRRNQSLSVKLHYVWSVMTGREFDCLALLDRHVRSLGLRLDRTHLERLAWLWYKPLGQAATIEADLHRHLETLTEQMSLKLGIVSNTFLPPVVLDRQLERFDLLRFFGVRAYSSITIFRKPDRRIYLSALRALNVPATAAVMVGDKVRQDITGSTRLGMVGVLKRHGRNRTARLPRNTPVIATIAELPDLIGSLNR